MEEVGPARRVQILALRTERAGIELPRRGDRAARRRAAGANWAWRRGPPALRRPLPEQ